jgi:hypothetical protein
MSHPFRHISQALQEASQLDMHSMGYWQMIVSSIAPDLDLMWRRMPGLGDMYLNTGWRLHLDSEEITRDLTKLPVMKHFRLMHAHFEQDRQEHPLVDVHADAILHNIFNGYRGLKVINEVHEIIHGTIEEADGCLIAYKHDYIRKHYVLGMTIAKEFEEPFLRYMAKRYVASYSRLHAGWEMLRFGTVAYFGNMVGTEQSILKGILMKSSSLEAAVNSVHTKTL